MSRMMLRKVAKLTFLLPKVEELSLDDVLVPWLLGGCRVLLQ